MDVLEWWRTLVFGGAVAAAALIAVLVSRRAGADVDPARAAREAEVDSMIIHGKRILERENNATLTQLLEVRGEVKGALRGIGVDPTDTRSLFEWISRSRDAWCGSLLMPGSAKDGTEYRTVYRHGIVTIAPARRVLDHRFDFSDKDRLEFDDCDVAPGRPAPLAQSP